MKKKKLSIFTGFMFVLLAIYSVTMVLLIAWILISALKDKTDFTLNPLGLPEKLYFSNFASVFNDLYVPLTIKGLGQYNVYFFELFLYSFIYSVGCTFVHIMARGSVAYVVAKYKFRLAPVLYAVNIFVMVIPIVGRLPSELQLMKALGLYDNIWALCIMKGSFTGMDFMLLHAAFSSVSNDYAEAAKIDGASHFTIMWKIMFPMVMQVMLILSLTSFIGYWNDWNVNITYMPSYPTAAYALYVFQNSNSTAIATGGVPYVLCACAVVMAPIIALFVIFRKQILGDINFGGLKG